jgi:hypothetical protein
VDDPLNGDLAQLAERPDVLRKKLVATKEGGAIIGEERLRELTANIYGVLRSSEVASGDYDREDYAR